MNGQPEIMICGAGIAGIATAYHLAVKHGVRNIWLVDERPPLSLTSDKSTEAYRNWWPGPDPAMVQMMNRSIDWLERIASESDNAIHLNRRGYAFASADPAQIDGWTAAASTAMAFGAGDLRLHDAPGRVYLPHAAHGWQGMPDGADLITEPSLIREHFGYLNPAAKAVLHVRRAGWLSAQQLGMYLLSQAQAAGVQLVRDRIEEIVLQAGCVHAVRLAEEGLVPVSRFVNAAGPYLGRVGQQLGVEIPVHSERHQKVSFADGMGIVPRAAPLLIWSDSQMLNWPEEERAALAQDPEFSWLLDPFPGGVHARPDGDGASQIVLMLWEYHTPVIEPVLPVPLDDLFPELTMRGMLELIPGLAPYVQRLPKPYVDGGYYTKTRENRPLAGPLPVEGAYLVGALSGFGIMAAMAMGELVCSHILGLPLPGYAPAFQLERYQDPAYQNMLANWGDSWQL